MNRALEQGFRGRDVDAVDAEAGRDGQGGR